MKTVNPMRGLRLHGPSYRLEIMRGGKREYINLQTSDPSVAIQRKRDILAVHEFRAPKGELTADVKRYIEWKVKQNIFTRQSARVAGAALDEFAEATKGNTSEVTLAHVQAHYAMLQERVKEATAQIHMRSLSAFFTWAAANGLCHIHARETERRRNRFGKGSGVPTLRFPGGILIMKKIDEPARKLFCTAAQRDELIAGAPTDDLKFIFMAGFFSGMRKNEIIEARVRWFQLDGKIGSVHIEKTPTFRPKDGEARFIPLKEDFRTFLRGYLTGKDPDDWALRPKTLQGKGIYRYDFHAPYNLYLAEKKMRWVTAHVMRHTFASLLAQSGRSIFKIATWLGDGVEVTQEHYAHLSPQDDDLELGA